MLYIYQQCPRNPRNEQISHKYKSTGFLHISLPNMILKLITIFRNNGVKYMIKPFVILW